MPIVRARARAAHAGPIRTSYLVRGSFFHFGVIQEIRPPLIRETLHAQTRRLSETAATAAGTAEAWTGSEARSRPNARRGRGAAGRLFRTIPGDTVGEVLRAIQLAGIEFDIGR